MNKENNMNRQRFSGFGARTRLNVLAGKNIRKGDDGKDIFDDYFTDDDGDSDGSDTTEFEPSCVSEKDSNVILNNSTSDSSKSKTSCIIRKDSSLVNDNVVADSSKSKASDVTHGHSSITQNNEQDTLPMNSTNSLAETIGNKHPDSLSPDVHVNTNSVFSNTCTDKNILSSSIRIGKKSLLPKEVPVRLTHTFTKPTRKTQSTAELDSMLNMYDEYDLQLMSRTCVSEDNTVETSEQEDDDSDHQGSNGEKCTSRSLLHNKNASPVSSKSFAFDGNKSGKNRVTNKKALVSSIPDNTDVIDNFQNVGGVNTNGKSEERNAEINIRRKTSLVLQSDNLNVIFSTEPKETETPRVGKSNNKSPEKSFLRSTRMSNSNRGDNNKSSLCQNEKAKPDTQTDGIEINGNVIASSETQTEKNEHAKTARHNKKKKIIQSPRKRQCNATFSISPNKNKSDKHTDALNSKDNPPLTSTAENNAVLGSHQEVVNATFCKSSSDRNEGEQIVYMPNRNRKTKLINSDDDDKISVSATYGSPDTDNQSPTTENRNSSNHQSAISALNEPSPSTNKEPPLDLARTFAPKKPADKSNNASNRGKQPKDILPSGSPLKKSLKSRKKYSSKLVVNSSTNPNIMDSDKSNDARKINKKRKILLPLNSCSKNKKGNSNKLVTTHQNINQADNDVSEENSEAAFTTSQNSAPENQGDKSNNTRQIRKSQRIKLPPPVSTLKSNLRSSRRNSSKIVENSSPTISQADNDILKETYAATFTNSQTSTPKKRANELDNGRLIKKQRLNLSPPISPLKSSLKSVKRRPVENSSPHEMDKEVIEDGNDVIEEETNELEISNILQNIQINGNDILDDEINEENSEAEREKQKEKNKREKQKEKNKREKQKEKSKREKHAETGDSSTNKELGETSGVKISKTKERKKVVRNGSVLDQGSSRDLPSSPKQQNYLSKKKHKGDKKRKHEVTAERKSCRQRFPPLEFWRNQRVVSIEKDGKKQLEIDSGHKIDNSASQAILAKRKRYREALKQKIPKPKATKLILPQENSIQSIELVKKFVHCVWENGSTENDSECNLELTRLFETNKAAFGYLRIEKSKEKPKQLMKDDDLFLVIVKGKAEITIQENSHTLSETDVFIVPRGIFYSVKNLGKVKLLIAYVVGKFRFLESAV